MGTYPGVGACPGHYGLCTVKPLYKDVHPRNEDISFNQDTMHGPRYVHEDVYKMTPETRTHPLIRTLVVKKYMYNIMYNVQIIVVQCAHTKICATM